MVQLLLHWVLSSLILFAIAYFLPGISIVNFGAALVATLVLSIVNLIVKPILSLLTLPINLLTLGLFSFIINALMFMLAASLVPGFEVSNLLMALVGSILLAIVTGTVFKAPMLSNSN
ncbi:MAG: phage holin family protein [Vampirovibrionales bacterium]|nr:phage holin family protein [Vampirovibrionales bacterium]